MPLYRVHVTLESSATILVQAKDAREAESFALDNHDEWEHEEECMDFADARPVERVEDLLPGERGTLVYGRRRGDVDLKAEDAIAQTPPGADR